MMALFKWYLDPLSPHELKKKKTSEFDPFLQNFLDPCMLTIIRIHQECEGGTEKSNLRITDL